MPTVNSPPPKRNIPQEKVVVVVQPQVDSVSPRKIGITHKKTIAVVVQPQGKVAVASDERTGCVATRKGANNEAIFCDLGTFGRRLRRVYWSCEIVGEGNEKNAGLPYSYRNTRIGLKCSRCNRSYVMLSLLARPPAYAKDALKLPGSFTKGWRHP